MQSGDGKLVFPEASFFVLLARRENRDFPTDFSLHHASRLNRKIMWYSCLPDRKVGNRIGNIVERLDGGNAIQMVDAESRSSDKAIVSWNTTLPRLY